ncbi:surface-adhesin E family protein [Qipengyuania sp. MTN3-11]|uniref:surface-adhesin E family protein n=1 Tax=Qipengyuania sp. MTN3-11 TaxID=3056557 RepID=UPI0036F23858
MADNDDVGCWIAVISLGVLGWYAYDKYEIRERDDSAAVVAVPQPLPQPEPSRPTGLVSLTETKNGSGYYLDAESVKGPKEARIGWVSIGAALDKTVAYRSAKELVWTNCDTGETKTLSRLTYNAEGDVLSSYDFTPEEASTYYYPPGTVGAAAPREMCKPEYGEP